VEIEDETDFSCSGGNCLKHNCKRNNHNARLQLLNRTFDQRELAVNEIEAIASHLITNVKCVKELFTPGDVDDFDTLCRLVQISPIIDLRKFSEDVELVRISLLQLLRLLSAHVMTPNSVLYLRTSHLIQLFPFDLISSFLHYNCQNHPYSCPLMKPSISEGGPLVPAL
jgi:hypothetical protein